MDSDREKIRQAVENTQVLRLPKQTLSTFGTTNLYYYIVTEPAYSEFQKDITETVIREGRVIAQRPKIVTPYYLSRLEGFSSEAKKYFELLGREQNYNAPALLYTYKNEPKELNIVSDNLIAVVEKLNEEIDHRGDTLASIIKGQDELWDVSLLKFIFEMTRGSVTSNVRQLGEKGLLNVDSAGIPMEVRLRIEEMFRMVSRGECEPNEMKEELERWGLFGEYEDRFLAMFKKG